LGSVRTDGHGVLRLYQFKAYIHMKYLVMLAALGSIALCTTSASSQQRDLGAENLILDDGAGNFLTITYAGGGSGTLTIPSGGGSMTPAGTTTDATLRWNGSAWVQNTGLLAGPDGIVTSRTTTANAGPYYGIVGTINDNNGGTIGNTAVTGIRMTATEGAGGDDEAVGGWFSGLATTGTAIGGRFSATGGAVNVGIDVMAGGISNVDGLDNNSGGIAEAGAVSGVTSLSVASGASRFAGTIVTNDASVDGTENFSNSLLTASSIVVVTANSSLGGELVGFVTPGAGSMTITFTGPVADGATLGYLIVNP
jgi:hypothetical protein